MLVSLVRLIARQAAREAWTAARRQEGDDPHAQKD